MLVFQVLFRDRAFTCRLDRIKQLTGYAPRDPTQRVHPGSSGMRQYRTIFLLSAYWSMASLLLAVVGSVLHFFEVRATCVDILHVDGAVNTHVAFSPPGVVVVCEPVAAPADAVEVPMATTAGVDRVGRSRDPRVSGVPVRLPARARQIDRGTIPL